MDLHRFFVEFQDHLAPKLDTYEQALYLYIFRHSRLVGQEEVVIGFKSARMRMAVGIGTKGEAMAEGTAYEKLRKLSVKGCIELLASERSGTRIRLKLPTEIPALVLASEANAEGIALDTMDFFEVPENRARILAREEHRCFYCLREINAQSYVIEHVMSRPTGDNTYRNVVAACRRCNNRKNSDGAEDWFRTLYREGLLSDVELRSGLERLGELRAGKLPPRV